MLTPKQEAFAQAIADGNNQAEAYRLAYDVGPRTKPETIYKRASELMTSGAVAGRVEHLRKALAEISLWSRQQSVMALRDIVESDATPAARIQAVRELNTMHGYNEPARLNVQMRDLPPIVDESWL
ncbi:MAG: hypothetical protein HQ482_10030 [Sphingomonadales bacterium]|nr:hypothetical protein [Sphingomonadales bacterium]